MTRSGWGGIVFWCLFFAVVCVVTGGLRFGYSPKNIALFAVTGILLGAIAAPDAEPRAFRYPALWQATCGMLAGIILAAAVQPTSEAVLAGGLIGLVLGYAAPYWIKHI